MPLKPITKYEIDDAGEEHVQFWRGRSTMGTPYDEVVIGQGDTCREALEDAIDQLAEMEYDVNAIPKEPAGMDLNAQISQDYIDDEAGDCEHSYYVAIFVR